MTDLVYTAILMPTNQCDLMGIEQPIHHARLGQYSVIITKDNFGQYRIAIKDIQTGIYVSAILFDQFRTIRYKYTLPEYRGQNLTKQAFAYIQMIVKRQFRHSDNLTEAGQAAI